MIVFPFQTSIFTEKFDLMGYLDQLLGVSLQDKDILVIASKVVSISEGQVIDLQKLSVCEEAWALSQEYLLEPEFCQAVLMEADEILGGVPGVITTIKNGIVTPYAGVDQSNVPKNQVVLWPKNPTQTAQKLRDHFYEKFHCSIGIIISDSQIVPLRVGTYGVAIAIAGFEGIIDKRGQEDLFGKTLHVTQLNIADNLASSANLVMGETTEKCPFAIIRDLPIRLSDQDSHFLSRQLLMRPEECLIFGSLPSWGGAESDNKNIPQFT